MKKKLTALLCTLCMAVTLCATAFATAATPTMTAKATLSEDKKQVTLELSLSGMDGNYTGMASKLDYDTNQITYNSHNNGKVFDTLTVSDDRTQLVWLQMSSPSVNTNGTAATLVFDVKDGVTGEIKIGVSSYITAYIEGNSGDPEDIDMAATSASVTIAAPQPTTAPTAEPTAAPTAEPTAAPTAEPTTAPTAEPTSNPTTAPTQKPSSDKSDKNDKKPDSTAAAATAVPAAQTPASPKTGDTANLALYGVLGVACVVALGVVIYRRKKANH